MRQSGNDICKIARLEVLAFLEKGYKHNIGLESKKG